MSITVGIYDLFAYTLPGFLYLAVIYRLLEFLNVVRLDMSTFDLEKWDSFLVVAAIIICAYIAGHIFDYVRVLLWKLIARKIFKRGSTSEIVLSKMQKDHPGLDIQFVPKEAIFLLSSLRLKNPHIAQVIDKYEADATMLRNIGLGLFFFTILQLFYCMRDNFQPVSVGIMVGSLIVGVLAFQCGYVFHKSFYTTIFHASCNYGKTLEAVIQNSSQISSK